MSSNGESSIGPARDAIQSRIWTRRAGRNRHAYADFNYPHAKSVVPLRPAAAVGCMLYFRSKTMSIQSINARNQFRGKIKEIILGPVVSEVDVDTPAGIVTSVITTRSVKELDLQVGTEVLAFVKATEVSVAKL